MWLTLHNCVIVHTRLTVLGLSVLLITVSQPFTSKYAYLDPEYTASDLKCSKMLLYINSLYIIVKNIILLQHYITIHHYMSAWKNFLPFLKTEQFQHWDRGGFLT